MCYPTVSKSGNIKRKVGRLRRLCRRGFCYCWQQGTVDNDFTMTGFLKHSGLGFAQQYVFTKSNRRQQWPRSPSQHAFVWILVIYSRLPHESLPRSTVTQALPLSLCQLYVLASSKLTSTAALSSPVNTLGLRFSISYARCDTTSTGRRMDYSRNHRFSLHLGHNILTWPLPSELSSPVLTDVPRSHDDPSEHASDWNPALAVTDHKCWVTFLDELLKILSIQSPPRP